LTIIANIKYKKNLLEKKQPDGAKNRRKAACRSFYNAVAKGVGIN